MRAVGLVDRGDRHGPHPGFPPHACAPAHRLETLNKFRDRGILTQATVSPLLPLANPVAFARQLDAACDRVILDHYLIGDGSPNGWRTRRTTLIERLEREGSVHGPRWRSSGRSVT